MNLMPLVVGWVVLAVALVVVLAYRSTLVRQEDDVVHIGEATALAASAQQLALAKKLETVERWSKILMWLVVLFGVALIVLFGYNAWITPPGM